MREIYRHYKGGFYEKLDDDLVSEAFLVPLVSYRCLKTGKKFVRAKALFDEEFTLVAIAEKNYYCPNCDGYHPFKAHALAITCTNCGYALTNSKQVIKCQQY